MVAAGTPVYEDGAPRRCNYGDFALLLRSPSANGTVFRRVLAEAGIPVQSRQGSGFFTSLEVTTAVNMLCVIDNPHADVPLISVLRSPAFAFSADELSLVRGFSQDGDYYTALCAAARRGNEKSARFLALLERLRAAAPELGVCGLLRSIYAETDLFALCSAMNGAGGRRGNLTLLFELAQRFESGGESGVLRFTAWLRRLAERGEFVRETLRGKDVVYLHALHEAETYLADYLARMAEMNYEYDFDVDELMHALEMDSDVSYAPLQREAIAAAAKNGVVILTGGPGTGKTTAVRGMLRMFEALGLNVVLAAPTGRAAKRLSELCGMEAKTIHRLLEAGYHNGGQLGF